MLNTLLDLPLGEVGSDLRQRDRHFSGSKGALRIQSTGAGGSGILLPNGAFHSHGGTPSYHPFLDGIFPYEPSSYWGTPNGHLQIVICR